MLAGNMYNQGDPQLVAEREKCRTVLMHLNKTFNHVERMQIANRIFGSIGRNVQIESPFYCEYGYTIMVGDDVTIGPNCVIIDPSQVTIGSRCCLGPNVCIGAKEVSPNPHDRAGIFTIAYSVGVRIEDRVSIEAGAIICNGAWIGRCSTIAAGAVVKGRYTAVEEAGTAGEDSLTRVII
ncbi:hypothetical protein SLS56_005172 [Neofusicoccum ribis]|uniref:Maltose/galactoside acetyltransferase domain-containing protein n=1 Tax=Neofusicoccum ribis TaxID=45134 RepID=A0ABR3SUF9_9PEZI